MLQAWLLFEVCPLVAGSLSRDAVGNFLGMAIFSLPESESCRISREPIILYGFEISGGGVLIIAYVILSRPVVRAFREDIRFPVYLNCASAWTASCKCFADHHSR